MLGEETFGGHIFDLHHGDIRGECNGFQRVVGENANADCVRAIWIQNACLEGEIGIVNAMDEDFTLESDFIEDVAVYSVGIDIDGGVFRDEDSISIEVIVCVNFVFLAPPQK